MTPLLKSLDHFTRSCWFFFLCPTSSVLSRSFFCFLFRNWPEIRQMAYNKTCFQWFLSDYWIFWCLVLDYIHVCFHILLWLDGFQGFLRDMYMEEEDERSFFRFVWIFSGEGNDVSIDTSKEDFKEHTGSLWSENLCWVYMVNRVIRYPRLCDGHLVVIFCPCQVRTVATTLDFKVTIAAKRKEEWIKTIAFGFSALFVLHFSTFNPTTLDSYTGKGKELKSFRHSTIFVFLCFLQA